MSRARYELPSLFVQPLMSCAKYPRTAMSFARPEIDIDDLDGQVNGALRAIAARFGSIARVDLPSALRSRLTSFMSAAPFESEPAGGGVATDCVENSFVAPYTNETPYSDETLLPLTASILNHFAPDTADPAQLALYDPP